MYISYFSYLESKPRSCSIISLPSISMWRHFSIFHCPLWAYGRAGGSSVEFLRKGEKHPRHSGTGRARQLGRGAALSSLHPQEEISVLLKPSDITAPQGHPVTMLDHDKNKTTSWSCLNTEKTRPLPKLQSTRHPLWLISDSCSSLPSP